MKRLSTLVAFLGVALVGIPAAAQTDTGVGDAGNGTDGDAATTADGSSADGGAGADHDVSISVDAGPIRRRRAFFVGEVAVQFRGDDGGVRATLVRTDGNLERQVTTDAGGRFEFRELPLGEYELRLELDGYSSHVETFELVGDREARYQLYRNVDFGLRVRASVPEGSEADRVTLELTGGPGEAKREEVPIDGGEGTWEVDDVKVGNWRLRAEAGELDPVSVDFQVDPEEADESVTAHVYLRTPEEVPPPSDSGCGCDPEPESASGRGGARPGGAFPTGPAALLLVFGLWRLRGRIAGRRESSDA